MLKKTSMINVSDDSATIQLKQQLIHVKSELTRYQQIVKKYKENYHYGLIDALETKNEELQDEVEKQAEELKKQRVDAELKSMALLKLKRDYKENQAEKDRLAINIDSLNIRNNELSTELTREKAEKEALIQKQKELELELVVAIELMEGAENSKLQLEEKIIEMQNRVAKVEKRSTENAQKDNHSWFFQNLQSQKKSEEDK
ncbi:hypothetical protein [Bacillus solitudinis]|uniref:hypothetical protein n=1 Tax=Bacillus solitudinis TaxID=2014074 RepID=UPI000C242E55|nr:hypothetical protein [Bacillus solitudinis]